ncbi:MAG: glycosyltransferase [Phycisphaerales bacterium]|nr:glycosyltransferase [Phycisphaerales bacterium]
MNGASTQESQYDKSNRPEIALITNHGYAGADIPSGGAADTGGQNFYVNTLAQKLERLGYCVTIFTRGGFPDFEGKTMRDAPAFLSTHVRYIFMPGGGSTFLRKEDIAIALDEEVEWLDDFVRGEASRRGCEPWEVYEFINSHYWDAGVIASRLIERWRDDLVAGAMTHLLESVIEGDELAKMRRLRHARALGAAPGFHLGRLLIHLFAMRHEKLEQQVRAAVSTWASVRRIDPKDENALVDRVLASVEIHGDADAPMRRLIAADALGRGILTSFPDTDERLKRRLDSVNRHVWTPHSLGELKDFNFHDSDLDTRRALKFCERRNHERVVADRSQAFVATSAKIADRLWSHYRVPVSDTFYFPPCVDTDVFRVYDDAETHATYEYLASRSGHSVERLRGGHIIFETSRMDPTKRKDLLLTAFATVAATHPDAFLFIGGGPENALFTSLQQQIEATAALRGRALLLHAIPDEHLGPLFSIADIYASASEMEGFGMSVSQAAAARTAVISSDLIPFSLHHAPEETVIFPAGDADALTAAMDRLLSDEGERDRRAGDLARVATSLDWERKASDFISYLRRRGLDIAAGVGS